MIVNCFAAKKRKSSVRAHSYTDSRLGAHEVQISISHCGLCRSDIHLIDNDWGISKYPLVPGHEIIGTVTEKGADVKDLEIGERVGVGWQRGACFTCEFCRRGDENLCEASLSTCVGYPGGFAQSIQIDSRFAFPIPANLSSEQAAPLLCGGITVFAPLRKFGVTSSMRVGVLGIGGLGHLALQFAQKMGCKVTALSSTAEKESDARRFGADHFIHLGNKKAFGQAASSLDFLLSTVNVDLEWASFLSLLRPDGKLCFVGVPQKPLKLPIYMLLDGRKSICGSPIGGRTLMKEMLSFASRHKVLAQTEVLPMARVNDAIKRVRENKPRYRMVLENK